MGRLAIRLPTQRSIPQLVAALWLSVGVFVGVVGVVVGGWGCSGQTLQLPTTSAASAAAHHPVAGQTELLIHGATVLDPLARSAKRRHILIRGEKIIALLKAVPAGYSGPVIDATGAFVVPAFVDMHVHSWGNPSPQEGPDHDCGVAETARFMLYCGVVAFLDLGSDEKRIFAFRDRQRSQGIPGADVYAAGGAIGHLADTKSPQKTPLVGAEHGPHRFRAAQTAAQARRHVAALDKMRADAVKVLYDHTGTSMSMPRDVLNAIAEWPWPAAYP